MPIDRQEEPVLHMVVFEDEKHDHALVVHIRDGQGCGSSVESYPSLATYWMERLGKQTFSVSLPEEE